MNIKVTYFLTLLLVAVFTSKVMAAELTTEDRHSVYDLINIIVLE